ncbi:aspartate--tRNA(Asn) ligase [Methanospirillum hungatei]|jgi:aspartyl-tRNA synthetase|uniref:aspartate--tRNA(Asn) ligase n=1 Tax=Methanospirillum hungatei TaxID=2203 RepID=UPI0009CCAE70|nr:aspartate--tRNA(Asn) ligase [Methanospirillum hungatei]MBP7034924.1 aspartate--tRNA(Asn) ligase [Methanospirillum sp.]MBP9009348.1 aspartate--tRNA(Asn) ligase [Methanospirillum sp.]OQA59257.1 MAG: Aspartate--tRNA ligase [Euryarchaeota archaeon ADurb.Bin294]HOW03585.1 aspartate--tRNA(Asn) ligase [Methanospirillum hungatei]
MRVPINTITPDTPSAEVIGWAHEIRDLGGLAFLLIRDRTGIIQVTVPKKKVAPEIAETIRAISRESVVRVTGTVKPEGKAPGGRELIPDAIEIVSLSATPLPLDVAEKVPAELDTRLDNRFLDARRPRVSAIFKIRNAVQHATRNFFFDNGFIEINTSKIVAAATEGGTELFPIAYFEKEAFLNQSPQLYKQMMMAAGFEKVYEIGPIFRAEEHNTTKHLNEATSIDIEVSFTDHLGVMQTLEDLIRDIYQFVDKTCSDAIADLGLDDFAVPEKGFPRLPYSEAIEIASATCEEDIAYGDDIGTAAERAIGEEMGRLYFIVDWPSSIRPYYAMPYENDPEICKAFDMMHPRMELSSGAQRVHQHDLLVEQIAKKGLNPENFEFYLNPFRFGMPPHAGWGLGAERLVTTMLGLPNVREAVLFPRDRHRVVP